MENRLTEITDISAVAAGNSGFFEKMLNSLYDGVSIFELRGSKVRAIYLNERYFEAVGYTREQYFPYIDNITVTLLEEDERRIIAYAKEAYSNGTDVFCEVRGNRFDGSTGWFNIRARAVDFIKSEYPVFIALISDITEKKKLELELSINRERYHILEETTSCFLFEYDCTEDTMIFSPGRARKDVVFTNYSAHIRRSKAIHSDDVCRYYNAISKACRKESKDFIDTRYLNEEGTEYVLCRNYYSSIENEYGEVFRVVGRMEYICEGSGVVPMLMGSGGNEDTIELLTPYRVGIEKITDCLGKGAKGFLAVIDVDDFTDYNKKFGYEIADSAIRLAAEIIYDVFRGGIIFRFTGDQFVVYMENISESDFYDMTEKLRLAGSMISLSGKDGETASAVLSFGVGAAWTVNTPKTTFNDYFITADKALFKAKKMGRGSVRVEKIIY